MYHRLLLALSMVVSFYCLPVLGNDKKPSNSQQSSQLQTNDTVIVSIIKKIHKGDSLDRDEKVFINTLGISAFTFGMLNGYIALNKLHLPATQSLWATGVGAVLGFVAGLPGAYFNYYEWYH